MLQKNSQRRQRENDIKGKENILGARVEDPKVDATNVAATTMLENALKHKRAERKVRREARPKGNQISIHNKGNGQDGIQDSEPRSGKTCAQETLKDGERASQKD